MYQFKVLSIDVWGNARDGWEENDYFNAGTIETKSEYPDARELFKALRAADILAPAKHARGLVINDYNNDREFFTVCRANGKPLLQLSRLS